MAQPAASRKADRNLRRAGGPDCYKPRGGHAGSQQRDVNRAFCCPARGGGSFRSGEAGVPPGYRGRSSIQTQPNQLKLE